MKIEDIKTINTFFSVKKEMYCQLKGNGKLEVFEKINDEWINTDTLIEEAEVDKILKERGI